MLRAALLGDLLERAHVQQAESSYLGLCVASDCFAEGFADFSTYPTLAHRSVSKPALKRHRQDAVYLQIHISSMRGEDSSTVNKNLLPLSNAVPRYPLTEEFLLILGPKHRRPSSSSVVTTRRATITCCSLTPTQIVYPCSPYGADISSVSVRSLTLGAWHFLVLSVDVQQLHRHLHLLNHYCCCFFFFSVTSLSFYMSLDIDSLCFAPSSCVCSSSTSASSTLPKSNCLERGGAPSSLGCDRSGVRWPSDAATSCSDWSLRHRPEDVTELIEARLLLEAEDGVRIAHEYLKCNWWQTFCAQNSPDGLLHKF